MRRRSPRYRRSMYHRRRRRNWVPFVVFVLVVGFFLWALFQFFSLLFSNVRTEIASTQLEILQGRGEFRLSNETSEWTPAFSGQNFVEGDQLQTSRNSHFKLTFFDNHHLFLNEDSNLELIKLERQGESQFTAHWRLNKGELWARVDSEAWPAEGPAPDVRIYTPRSVVNVTGTTFNLASDEAQDTLRLIQGGVKLDILDENDEAGERITVSVGQEMAIDDTTKNLVEPASQLGIINPDFLESDWHLKNLAFFEPEAVEATRAKIQASQAPPPAPVSEETENTEDDLGPVNPDLAAPEILSPAPNASIPATIDSIAIEGTAPAQAFQIQVNGYTLGKFQPGDRKWTYFAATKFNTLQSGANTYRVVAIDRQGQRSPVTELTLNYEGVTQAPVTETLSVEETIANFPPPRVTTPTLFAEDPTATYQTSADRVTLFGEVPVGTNAVKVNGFQLRKFNPGDTKFQYTAIALGVNGNMQEGENQYTIVAVGPDGKSSETTVKVVYTPLALEE